MAECEKCGKTLDENEICNCDAAVEAETYEAWARPGSAIVKRPHVDDDLDSAVSSNRETDRMTQTELSPDSQKIEDAVPSRPKYAQSQIGTAEQRAAYFNAMAGVEEEEIDEQFYVSETGLFDVPYNDTKENLGYNFPKFRQRLSKKAKKKIRIGSVITAGVCLAITALIVLSNYFDINLGIFSPTPEIPIIYSDGSAAYLMTNKGKIESSIYYSDRVNTITNTVTVKESDAEYEVNRLSFTDDKKRMLTIEKYESSNKTYTLHERDIYSEDWITAENNGTLVDTGICSRFKFISDGGSMVYLKLIGDSADLCIYSFEEGTVKKVASGVTSFSVLSENSLLYLLNKDMYTLTYNSHSDFSSKKTNKNVHQVVTAYDYGYRDSADYFYVTEKPEKETRNELFNVGVLHYVKGGKSTIIDKDVESIVMPCFYDDTVYYYKSNMFTLNISAFVEDDCAESDAQYVEIDSKNEDIFNTSTENLAKFLRYNLRNIRYGESTFSILDTPIYNEVKKDLWYNNGTKSSEIAVDVINIVNADEKSKTIVYKCGDNDFKKAPFSQIEQPYLQSENAIVSYCHNVLLPTAMKIQFAACSGKTASKLDASFVRKASCDAEGKTLYFIDTEKEKSKNGTLKSVSTDDLSACQTVVESINDFDIIGNSLVSVASNGDFYHKGERIAQNVSSYLSAQGGKSVVFLSDYDEYLGVGTLRCLKKDSVDTIAADVHDFAVYSDKILAYIGDYNKVEKKGTVYISSGIKEGKPASNEARSLIRY